MKYLLEVAPWCPSNSAPATIIEATSDTEATRQAETSMDADTYARLRPDTCRNAWEDNHTITGWNITGNKGTYQARLTKA